MTTPRAPFEDLVLDFERQTVFLDVDGTLAPDGELEFSDAVKMKVKELADDNQVLLCTNKRDRRRWQALESLFSLPVVTKRRRKPSRRVLEEAKATAKERIVIGDKFLTDYLFARRIGARFIRVRRKVSGQEPLIVRAVNWLDDVLWNLLRRY